LSPGRTENANVTLFNTTNGKYWWGTGSKRKYETVKTGDYLFFYLYGNNYMHRAKVISKMRLEDIGNEKWWPYKRDHWKYIFEIELPVETKITIMEFFERIKNHRPTKGCTRHFQQQTMIRNVTPELARISPARNPVFCEGKKPSYLLS